MILKVIKSTSQLFEWKLKKFNNEIKNKKIKRKKIAIDII